ncbi:hypothetical protein M0R45_009805 [Rubus argutus]|uniref:Uncharacterized protein n=1 Tax=Rubus argutus TaxID=59490 RepID=A0AAW1Y5S1_RUBAR
MEDSLCRSSGGEEINAGMEKRELVHLFVSVPISVCDLLDVSGDNRRHHRGALPRSRSLLSCHLPHWVSTSDHRHGTGGDESGYWESVGPVWG